MALKKTVRSILLHKGMSDDADRFLVEPPAVDYAENLRLEKEGSFRKRKGFDSLGSPSNPAGEPNTAFSFGNSLYLLQDNGAFVYDGSWREARTSTFMGSKDVELETAPQYGVGHCDHAPYYVNGELVASVVVYEVQASSTVGLGENVRAGKFVVVEYYNAEGKKTRYKKIENAQSPKLCAVGDDIYVFYNELDTNDLFMRRTFPTGLVGEPLGPSIFFDIPVTDETTLPSHRKFGTIPSGRIGEAVSGGAHYHVAATDDTVFVFSTERTVSDVSNLWLGQFTLLGTQEHLVRIHQETTNNDGCLALDVIADGFNVWCFYTSETGSPPAGSVLSFITSRIHLEARNASNITQSYVPEDSLSLGDTSVLCGGIVAGPGSQYVGVVWQDGGSPTNYVYDSDAAVAEHLSEFNVLGARPTDNAIRWTKFQLVGGFNTARGRMFHHRLVSRPTINSDGTMYCCVQQWADYTPFAIGTSLDDYNKYAPIGPARKPVTTALVSLSEPSTVENSTRATPIAVVDPGSGQHTDPGMAMLTTHLPSIWMDGADYLLANRVIQSASDLTYYIGRYTAFIPAGQPLPLRVGNIEVGSLSLCRVHRVSQQTSAIANQFGDGVLLGTAVPQWFDGDYFGEAAPLDSPEIVHVQDQWQWLNDHRGEISYVPNPGHGGDNKYRALNVVVGYYDTHGNAHRSAPSQTIYVNRIDESATEADGSLADDIYLGRKVNVTFTAPLTMLHPDLEYFVELYVSKADDDDPVLAETQSLPASTTGTFADYVIEAQLLRAIPPVPKDLAEWDPSSQTLVKQDRVAKPVYTQGGYLAADPWPSFTLSVVTSTRLWTIDSDNRGRVHPSKLFEDYIAPEYNPSLAINLGDERDLTAIGKLDDKVVVFEPNDIHVIYGDGPDNRGQGQDFAVHYISTDVGCTDQESVIETPVGLIFYSAPRGFYMLDRNLQVRYIGGGIEDTTRDIDILSATLIQDNAEVRFAFTGGPAEMYGPDADTSAVERPPRPVFTNTPPATASMAVYNYEQNAWTLFSNVDAQAAAIYQQKYTILRSDWSVWQESDTRWDDPDGDNLVLLRTPWIRLSEQIQGYNRLWEMEFLGRYYDSLRDLGGGIYEASDIGIRIAYDYEATFLEDRVIPFQKFGYDPFNAVPKRAERLQFRIAPRRGRCQAIKLEVYQLDASDRGEGLTYKAGPGFELSAIDFHVGVSDQRSLIPEAVKF